ncbi:MAG TPA: 50S ribosomal protein L29 [Candidatus Nanoarchaeia archaeon]|nr:50S ribosomal protein L29 [Candidatus Nanoarchaeia archaeon]
MKQKELKALGSAELNEKLNEIRKNLIKLHAQVSTGTTPKSPGEIRKLKKTIARILTIQNSKREVEKKA